MVKKGAKLHFTEDDRKLLWTCLNSMGVSLPSTKLPIGQLERKLIKSLDSAQRQSRVLPELVLDPGALRKWTDEDGSVLDATKRGNVMESVQNKIMAESGQNSSSRLYKDVFYDLRQTMLSLGNSYDNGLDVCMIQDKDEQSALALRVVDVLFFNKKTPVFIVLFDHAYRGDPSMDSLRFLRHYGEEDGYIGIIKATVSEQKILLRLLRLNSTRLSLNYSPERIPLEENFILSFLLPLGPLAQSDIAQLVEYVGCVICGEPNKSKCSDCMIESYCSKECQRADWPEHKKICRSVAGGTWTTMTFSIFPKYSDWGNNLKEFAVMSYINRYTASDDPFEIKSREYDNPIPPNIYGDRPFVIKIQLSFDRPDVLIYDRRRSLHVHITPLIDAKAFPILQKAVIDSPILGKIYRWAKRDGDTSLRVCVDKEPQEYFNW